MKLEQKVLKIVGLFAHLGMVPTTADSFEDLSMDSLDRSELLMELEEEFDICIPDEVAESIHDVAGVISLIEEML